MKEVALSNISIDREEVCRCLGYGPGVAPSKEVKQKIEDMIAAAGRNEYARGAFTEVPVYGVDENQVKTPHGCIKSRQISKISGNADGLVFGLVTLGEAFDKTADEISDMVDACLWDAIGTALVEESVSRLIQEIENILSQNISLPFSPGYCDWALTGQENIFAAFFEYPIGIHVSKDSWVMTPRKSVSFAACVNVPDKGKNPCRLCNMKNCFMRRTK